MQADRIPLSRSELLEMQRWIRNGWTPDESTVKRLTDSLVAVVMDSETKGRGRDRARVRAFRLIFEIECAAKMAAIELEAKSDSHSHY